MAQDQHPLGNDFQRDLIKDIVAKNTRQGPFTRGFANFIEVHLLAILWQRLVRVWNPLEWDSRAFMVETFNIGRRRIKQIQMAILSLTQCS